MSYPGKIEKAAHSLGFVDNFGKLIADSTTNYADLGAHHKFTPERYRLYNNGTRQFPHYTTISAFSDDADSYDISPSVGDSWTLTTAEQFSYRVGYVIVPSFAFQTNQSLQGNDIVAISYGTADLANVTGTDLETGNADGWVMYMTGSMADDEARFAIFRNGVKKREIAITLNRPITSLRRFAMPLDWYNVGTSRLRETYVRSGQETDRQENEEIAAIGVDDDRGPRSGNQKIEYAVKADTSGLTLQVGSSSLITWGSDVKPVNRQKPVSVTLSTPSGNDTWHPIYALRRSSDYSTVSTRLSELDILNYGNTTKVELMAIAVDPSKTDASGWGYPDHVRPYNTAVESTSTVTQVPNRSGVQTAPGTSFQPGGHSLALSVLEVDNSSKVARSDEGADIKKNIYKDDVVVFLFRSPNAGGSLTFTYTTDENF